MTMKHPILFRLALCAVLMAVFVAIGVENSAGLEVTHTALPVAGLPEGLRGLRIAEISDLHSCTYGAGQSQLIDAVKGFRPDLIVLAGDIIDGITPDAEPCAELVKGLAPIAPVYRVRGNHEYYLDDATASAFDARMAACGAILLDNQSAVLQKNGQSYLLSGINDATEYAEDPEREKMGAQQFDMQIAENFMSVLNAGKPHGNFPLQIMVCHQPQFWQLWQEAGYDVALCGHLHGWLVRIPGVGGIMRIAPNLFFPEEDAGLYDKQGTLVYISRGLDDHKRLRSIRINNKPELALLEVVAR